MWTAKITHILMVVLFLAYGLLAACGGPESTQAPAEEVPPTAAPTATPQREEEPPSPTEDVQPTASPTPTPEPQEEQPSPSPTAVSEEQTAEPAPSWEADGIVADGEYPHQVLVGDVTIWWRNDATSLYLAMEASTTGWVAVGLDPTDRMQGANFILGLVVEGEAQIWDAYGTAPTGNTHPPDEELGGTNDVVAYAGVEEGGVTRFEVQIPLDSGDEFDRPLEPGGTYPVIAAVGPSDVFDVRHSSRAGGSITLD